MCNDVSLSITVTIMQMAGCLEWKYSLYSFLSLSLWLQGVLSWPWRMGGRSGRLGGRAERFVPGRTQPLVHQITWNLYDM